MGAKKIAIQERDLQILRFIDRVGYANIKQITRAVGDEKLESGVLQRLYMLRRFGYLKTFTTQKGNYFALDRKGRGENALIFSIKLDQLLHHDFLIDVYFLAEPRVPVLSERECITKFKVVGKKGKIPDMVINEWIIEFERTSKSVLDSKATIDYWTVEQAMRLCVICENDEIKNRYTALLNPRVRVLDKSDYHNILSILVDVEDSNGVNVSVDEEYVSTLKNKYL